ncbi:MAG: hypothetical protein V3U78_03790 [Thiotrichaceae bacterium]
MIKNLQDLYKADFKHLPEVVIRDLEATEEIQQLRRDIKEKVPGSNWTHIRAEVLLEMQQLLDIKLQPILVESWKTHQDVDREIYIQNKTVSDEKAIVSLSDHEIRSTHSPRLNIKIGDTKHPMRTFIAITLNLRDVSLVIQHGEIKEILTGTVKGKGFMQYQNATLIEKEFLGFDIAGKIDASTTTDNVVAEPLTTIQADTPQGITPVPTPQVTPRQESTSATSPTSNMVQFIIGVSIALIAVFLFWQFK